MARQIIDLSVSLQADIKSDPPGFTPQIKYVNHSVGAAQMAEIFPGLNPKDLPGGEGWAVEFVQMSTHAGTHMDAPYHYRSKMDEGEATATIDEIPLEWCFGPGVKLDFRHLPDGHVVSPEEIDAELARIGHRLSPGDIVLVNTSAGARYGQDDYLGRGCGMGRAATLHLTRQGVHVVGTDAWSWDAPFSSTRERFAREGDISIIWEGHFAGSTVPYCQIEKMANLERLPATGFAVVSLPVKVHKGSAGWARPVAIIESPSAN
jgi:kynurenine formamidase